MSTQTNGTALIRHTDQRAIAKRDESAGFTESEVDLIKTQIAPGVTDGELKLFLHVCKSRQLDPFAKQVYAIVREQWNNDTRQREKKMTIMASIDGFRLTAKRGGIEAIDEPEFEYDARLRSDSNPLGIVKATVRVWRKGVDRPTVGVAYWDEYAQTKRDGGLMGLWPKMPRTMIAKCAEAQALRKAAPEELSGLYAPEEMDQAASEPREQTTPAPKVEARVVDQPQTVTSLSEDEFAFAKQKMEEATSDVELNDIGKSLKGRLSDEQRANMAGHIKHMRNRLAKRAREAAEKAAQDAGDTIDSDPQEIEGEVIHAGND
jgi:phage recombination protein Bet